jgi:hypothetical protein
VAAQWTFDPDRVAQLEARGWRAYYDRQWPQLAYLMIELCQAEFRIPFPVSLVAAYYVVRATQAWAPVDHDVRVAQGYYAAFYRLAGRYSGLGFDPRRVAALELAYDDVHRRLVGVEDKTEFVNTLVELHTALFGLSPEQARPSAEWRVQAAEAVDRITSGRSVDVAADWATVEQCLRNCYRSIQHELEQQH